MQLNQISGNWRHSLIESSALWHRDINSINLLDLQIFLRQHWGTAKYTVATSEVKDLCGRAWDLLISGEIENPPPIIYFEAPNPRLTMDEFIQWLLPVSLERRKAILFALETGCSIKETVELKHSNIPLMTLTPMSVDIVRSMARHIRLENVFWEKSFLDGKPLPLVGLADSVNDVSQGMGFDALRRLYKDIIKIDRTDDLHEFFDLVLH